jgi:RNA polymerase sigma factor (sigma-70 family)
MSEDALVRGINEKDPKAFGILFKDHLPKIVLPLLVNYPLYAEDAACFAMEQLWLSKITFNTLISIKAFLRTTTTRRCIDNVRQANRNAENEEEIAGNVHGPVIDEEEDSMDVGADMFYRLNKAIQDLLKEEREVIVLAYLEGLSNKEIVKKLGKSYDSIAGLKKRAVKRLKSMLL